MKPGDIISYTEIVLEEEGTRVQRGMNYRIQDNYSIFLMSTREGAPYNDEIRDEGTTLIYEGHDARKDQVKNPKQDDQPMHFSSGKLTQNGKFYKLAQAYQNGERANPEPVKVYEKIKTGIWVYNGIFDLVDAWLEESNGRKVFKFELHLAEDFLERDQDEQSQLEHARLIPMNVKREVWERDEGQCQECGAEDNLHFDHIIPYSKGGTSLTAENIQLLCARHNLQKSDSIQ